MTEFEITYSSALGSKDFHRVVAKGGHGADINNGAGLSVLVAARCTRLPRLALGVAVPAVAVAADSWRVSFAAGAAAVPSSLLGRLALTATACLAVQDGRPRCFCG